MFITYVNNGSKLVNPFKSLTIDIKTHRYAFIVTLQRSKPGDQHTGSGEQDNVLHVRLCNLKLDYARLYSDDMVTMHEGCWLKTHSEQLFI